MIVALTCSVSLGLYFGKIKSEGNFIFHIIHCKNIFTESSDLNILASTVSSPGKIEIHLVRININLTSLESKFRLTPTITKSLMF